MSASLRIAEPPDDEPTDPGVGHAQVCQVGKIYGAEWEVIELNSFGGQGEVYTVAHTRTKKRYALKVLRRHVREDPIARDRFIKEGEVLHDFLDVHPGIVQVHQIGTDREIGPYIVMELLVGCTLEAQVNGPLPPLQGLATLIDLAEIFTVVHGRGIIHRDVKPSNIFVLMQASGPPIIKLIDFGAMKGGGHLYLPTTKEGRVIGTVDFMAPEQMRGEKPSPSMDIFALGMTAYWLFCRLTPYADMRFGAATREELLMWGIAARRVPIKERIAHFPASVSDIVDRMIRARPEDRFQSMEEVADACRAAFTELERARAAQNEADLSDERRMNEAIRAKIAEEQKAKPGGMATAYNLHLPPADPSERVDDAAALASQRDRLVAQVDQYKAAVRRGTIPPNLDLGEIEKFIAQFDAALGPSFGAAPSPAAPSPRHAEPVEPATSTKRTEPTMEGPVEAAPSHRGGAAVVEQRFACLVGLEAPFASMAWELARASLRIGRDATADVVVDDASVSALHARLEPRKIGGVDALELIDAGSSNGTFVSGERIEKRVLKDRDRLVLGRVRLEYRVLGGAAAVSVLKHGTPRTEKLASQLPVDWFAQTAAYREWLDAPQKTRAVAVRKAPRTRVYLGVGLLLIFGLLIAAFGYWRTR